MSVPGYRRYWRASQYGVFHYYNELAALLRAAVRAGIELAAEVVGEANESGDGDPDYILWSLKSLLKEPSE